MSEFFIFSSIPVLMIIGSIGKGDDDEGWMVGMLESWNVGRAECSKLCECRRTPSRDSDVGIEDEVRQIFLRNPVEELYITSPQPSPKGEGVFEIHSHIGIEFAEDKNHLMIPEYYLEILEYLLEDRSCSLAPTDDENMFFISFPENSTPSRFSGHPSRGE